MRKIGILTGGGDCPGLNATIRGVVEKCISEGIEVYGFMSGWRGALTGEGKWLTLSDVEGIQTMGGTILCSSRTNVMKEENGPARVKATMDKLGLEGLVAIGGDDTLGVANALRKMGMNMVGVPKTIDNDLFCTDYTFGFDSASNIAMEAIDRLHTTAQAHQRCIVVELMGRHTGWIAIQAGLAANAHIILIPEFPLSFDQIFKVVRDRFKRGEKYTIIAAAEGFELAGEEEGDLGVDAFGNRLLNNKDLGKNLSDMIERAIREDKTLNENRKYFESRSVVLGHLQRGGSPSVFDRVLGTRLGVKAGELAVNREYGNMVAISGTKIVTADLDTAVTERKEVGSDLYDIARLYCR
ncbi:MAG: Pyrophosphate--fructose 6-phosphate 1-phosphotransferase [Firmicutes bacterium ADurb.Bin182]|nr:MAG: Pyrophosphate--fructose 6-phosphate 1-phosphotransferase [Firmicutes bacterium ADurb.Bin182]